MRPSADDPQRVRRQVRSFAVAATAVAGALSAVLFASQLHATLRRLSGAVDFKLAAAVGLGCLCAASWLVASSARGRRAAGGVLAALAALLGVVALLAHLADLDPATGLGGSTALLLAGLGGGIALGVATSRRLRTISDVLVLSAAAICLLALISRLFGARSQYPPAAYEPMLTSTAIIGLALSIAAVLQRPERGLGQLLNSSASGGVLARRLIPVLIAAPIVIARLTWLGVDAGVFDAALAAALSVVASVVILVVVLVGTGRVVDRLEAVRHGNEAQIRQMVQDISRHSEEVQRSNRELEAFSYSMSHDLRAPVRHLAGFAELLSNHAGERLDAKGKNYLKIIAESACNAGQLIDELLEFSRIGRSALHARDLDLAELVRDSWNGLVMERRGRDIELVVGALPAVHADATLTGLIFANLLSNAVKYTAPRDHAIVEVTARRDGDDVLVDVRDNGTGFDMKYADKLFGVFQRLHGDEFPGTGIGLANVKRIVERHGGRVWADGKLDGGARFGFSLPGAKEQT